jgi:hypothetical protein
LGVGAHYCGQYTKAYEENPTLAEALHYEWTLGFISALNGVTNLGNGSYRDIFAISQEEQQRFLRSWCNDHPKLTTLTPYLRF